MEVHGSLEELCKRSRSDKPLMPPPHKVKGVQLSRVRVKVKCCVGECASKKPDQSRMNKDWRKAFCFNGRWYIAGEGGKTYVITDLVNPNSDPNYKSFVCPSCYQKKTEFAEERAVKGNSTAASTEARRLELSVKTRAGQAEVLQQQVLAAEAGARARQEELDNTCRLVTDLEERICKLQASKEEERDSLLQVSWLLLLSFTCCSPATSAGTTSL